MEAPPNFVMHVSRVVVEAMTGDAKVESRPRATTESLEMEGMMVKRRKLDSSSGRVSLTCRSAVAGRW